MQFEADGAVDIGIIELELFFDDCPITCQNFRSLCVGKIVKNSDIKPGPGIPDTLTYKGSPMHRIIPGFIMQGGDFTKGDGTGGISSYGKKFADENYIHKHDGFGNLCMANNGPMTNGSQFYITFTPCGWLNDKDVVFGKLITGEETARKIESYGTRIGKPSAKIIIKDCGISLMH